MRSRDRAYRRYQRNRSIHRKKRLSNAIYHVDWFQTDGKYNKGHIGCGCWLCKPGKRFCRPSLVDVRNLEGYKRDIEDYWNESF